MTGTLEGTENHVVESVRVPMRDGARLAGRLHRAPGGARPVLLIRTPYAEPMSRTLPVLPALDAGFSVLVQECRGTGRSDGELRTFENETSDGLDTLAWLVAQPWCDGRIAMFGMSYLGMAQLAVSGHRPPGLVALAPTVTPDDYRDGLVYRQGAFQLGQAVGWHLLTAAQLAGGPTPALGRLLADPVAAYRTLPLADRPGISEFLPSWRTWLDREDDPAYWHGISYASRRATCRRCTSAAGSTCSCAARWPTSPRWAGTWSSARGPTPTSPVSRARSSTPAAVRRRSGSNSSNCGSCGNRPTRCRRHCHRCGST
ncbi:hypothetical protein GCM10023214_29800 [Amycolatopsis dongchuanensis]|uniref:Xaa-Pro dipeptidyl-peptidase-like domain-containing protein n=2 Tax=Amycolatopsis TaxID=1813 RepID=A0A1I3Q3I9_9PSEU|nr:hypothetical protein SAMN05421835_104153 [Amycolatopsis sacchari]